MSLSLMRATLASHPRAPDAAQRPSRCAAEPGPILRLKQVARMSGAISGMFSSPPAPGDQQGKPRMSLSLMRATLANHPRAPDAAQRPSRSAAEPGPTVEASSPDERSDIRDVLFTS